MGKEESKMLSHENRINTKSELNDWIEYERKKYGGGTTGILREVFPISESDVLRKHQVLLRKTEYHTNCGHKIRSLICKIKLYRLQNRYALHIPINTCGRGLKIMHVGPILMNGKVTVGKDCSFHINTALVAGGTNNDVPYLEDGVVVGIGAVVLGNAHIARNVAIGANAVVNKNISDENIAVAGVPAHKVSDGGSLRWNQKESRR